MAGCPRDIQLLLSFHVLNITKRVTCCVHQSTPKMHYETKTSYFIEIMRIRQITESHLEFLCTMWFLFMFGGDLRVTNSSKKKKKKNKMIFLENLKNSCSQCKILEVSISQKFVTLQNRYQLHRALGKKKKKS